MQDINKITLKLEDNKADNIVVLETESWKEKNGLEGVIICSATSSRHLHNLYDKLKRHAKECKTSFFAEGHKSSRTDWILCLIGSYAIHLLLPALRTELELEVLYKN
jgi:ribosomal silencing factor RsfS